MPIRAYAPLLAAAMLIVPACSVRRFAINKIGDTLASSSGGSFEKDDDLELVGDALPFGLKLMESLLMESPKHRGLLIAACQGFATYSYVFVQQEADRVALQDLDRANEIRARSRRLYLRARGYGVRALDLAYPGSVQKLETSPKGTLAAVRVKDLPLLYWNAAALGLAISVSRNDAEMLSRLPEVEALLGRAMELDESWQQGSLHELEITMASAKPGAAPDVAALKKHFDRALELSGGNRASTYTTWAESISVRTQNRAEFRTMLNRALSIDLKKNAEGRLQNEVSQRRARWLLSRIDELFLEEEKQ